VPVSSEIDALRAQVARLQADLDAAQALSAQGATMAAALADQHQALRLAAEAYLDARDEARPLDEADARRRLDALLGRAPRPVAGALLGSAGPMPPRGIATLHPSAARRFGLGGGSGTRGGEG